MELAAALPLPVGLVRGGRHGVHAIVVKLGYDIGSGGIALPARQQQPLGVGRNKRALVIEPSDFSGPKSACDVALIGAILRGAQAPAVLAVGSLELRTETATELAARVPTRTDPQLAAPACRMPFPDLPLTLAVEAGGVALAATIQGPRPLAGLIRKRAARLIPLELWIDAVLVDPLRARCTLLYKGVFHHPGDVDRDLVLVVDVAACLPHVPLEVVTAWPRYECEETVDLTAREEDEDAPLGDEETTGQFRIAQAAPSLATTSLEIPLAAANGDPLPFTRVQAERAPGTKPVMFIGMLGAQGTPLAYPPTPFANSPGGAASGQNGGALVIDGFTLYELGTLRRELWAEPGKRRLVLRRHGLNELRWRAIEQRFAEAIDAMLAHPEQLAELVTQLSGGQLSSELSSPQPD